MFNFDDSNDYIEIDEDDIIIPEDISFTISVYYGDVICC